MSAFIAVLLFISIGCYLTYIFMKSRELHLASLHEEQLARLEVLAEARGELDTITKHAEYIIWESEVINDLRLFWKCNKQVAQLMYNQCLLNNPSIAPLAISQRGGSVEEFREAVVKQSIMDRGRMSGSK